MNFAVGFNPWTRDANSDTRRVATAESKDRDAAMRFNRRSATCAGSCD